MPYAVDEDAGRPPRGQARQSVASMINKMETVPQLENAEFLFCVVRVQTVDAPVASRAATLGRPDKSRTEMQRIHRELGTWGYSR